MLKDATNTHTAILVVPPTTADTLCKFLRACALLGEVYNTDTAFATMLMPASTERFLEESAQRLTMIENALRS